MALTTFIAPVGTCIEREFEYAPITEVNHVQCKENRDGKFVYGPILPTKRIDIAFYLVYNAYYYQ